jgi:hypothetical protein
MSQVHADLTTRFPVNDRSKEECSEAGDRDDPACSSSAAGIAPFSFPWPVIVKWQ